jgi:O-Antigen ligase
LSVLDDAATPIELPTWQAETPANALADRFLHVALYITVLSSFYVLIEPAPYDYLIVVLGFACVLARVRVSRVVLPLLVLLLIRDAGGAVGLLKILNFGWMRLTGDPTAQTETFEYPDSIRFLAISFYLGLSGIMYACICAQDTMRRIATLRSAYIMAGVSASLLGTAAYFQLFPGLEIFTTDSRLLGGFKGPNDFGAFSIPALLWLIEGFIVGRIRLHNLIASIIIFIALLLSFSRGAWGSCLVSAVVMIYLLYITQNDRRLRKRIIFFVAAGIVAAIAIFMLLSSIDAVSQMFAERSRLQAYDIGADNRSRFLLQRDSLLEIFNHPLGMGPWGFAHATNWVSHNTYLGTTLNHGWAGGAAYLTLIVLTLTIGFRAIWMRTPWQTFLIATYVSFIAMVFEGVWGDTDHWRHFYLLLGLVWGLVAANQKVAWRSWQEHAGSAQLVKARLPEFQQPLENPT